VPAASALAGAAAVIVGEGSLDEQSLAGTAPVGVARRARDAGVPVVAVCGRLAVPVERLRAVGIGRVVTLSDLEPDPASSMARAAELVEEAGRRLATDLPDAGDPRRR
jgi:glycerate kinase